MGRRWGGPKDAELTEMHAKGATVPEMILETGYTNGGVRAALKRLQIVPVSSVRGRPAHGHVDVAARTRAISARTGARMIKDRRRFKHNPVPFGDFRNSLDRESDAAKHGETIFPERVFEPSALDSVLIDGLNNSKIGGDVLVGNLKGARIFTLTLEERATCPRSCLHWLSCYGNSMQWSKRWRAGTEFEAKLEEEVEYLCGRHEKVLIRLHVLGDFYSAEYVDLWRHMMARHRNLNVFGFTARGEHTVIGRLLMIARSQFKGRWMIRTSGTCGPMGSFTIDFPTEKTRIGDAVVCPEQRDAMEGSPRGKHCGNCAVCWETPAAIVFVEH